MSQYVYASIWPYPFIGMSAWLLSPFYCIPIWKNYRRIKGIIRWQIELGIPALWSGRRWKNNKIGNAGNSKRNELKQLISICRMNFVKFSVSIFHSILSLISKIIMRLNSEILNFLKFTPSMIFVIFPWIGKFKLHWKSCLGWIFENLKSVKNLLLVPYYDLMILFKLDTFKLKN